MVWARCTHTTRRRLIPDAAAELRKQDQQQQLISVALPQHGHQSIKGLCLIAQDLILLFNVEHQLEGCLSAFPPCRINGDDEVSNRSSRVTLTAQTISNQNLGIIKGNT
ncbi:MAG: hypothetical protein AAGD25_12530 [Cyanobacteria bacterium P01_F01_bin.150]